MNILLHTAIPLAEQAALAITQLTRNSTKDQRKADHSIVTEADFIANQIIVEGLQKAFPDHAILSEETGLSGNINSEYVWVIDPLDGTKAYAKGIPGYSVMIGLLKNRKPYLGIVKDPLEGHLYAAVKGEGASHTWKGRKQGLRVSSRNLIQQMPLILSPGFPENELNEIRQKLTGPLIPPINSVGIKVGLLVRQIGDIYLNHHSVSYWDTVAPQIILEETGGVFSTWEGNELKYDLEKAIYDHGTKTIASNNQIHSFILQKISS
ncbi:MAG: inositol monophosphatase [Deltaproteobacteria bacterium]|nr:inositol monophosphatase [Deltaproteobacteria bacterium]